MILPVPVAIDGDEICELLFVHPFPELTALVSESVIAVAVSASAGILEHGSVRGIGTDNAVRADQDPEMGIALEQRPLQPFLLLRSPDGLRGTVGVRIGR